MASNDVSISIILVGEKTNIPVTRLSCFHYSLCLFDAHVLYKQENRYISTEKEANRQQSNTKHYVVVIVFCAQKWTEFSCSSNVFLCSVRAHIHDSLSLSIFPVTLSFFSHRRESVISFDVCYVNCSSSDSIQKKMLILMDFDAVGIRNWAENIQ